MLENCLVILKLAQENIKKALKQQKSSYDKFAREPTIKVNDLIMLKVEPCFKLDRLYRGPYRVIQVTSTSLAIQPIHNPRPSPGMYHCKECLSVVTI